LIEAPKGSPHGDGFSMADMGLASIRVEPMREATIFGRQRMSLSLTSELPTRDDASVDVSVCCGERAPMETSMSENKRMKMPLVMKMCSMDATENGTSALTLTPEFVEVKVTQEHRTRTYKKGRIKISVIKLSDSDPVPSKV
jgi:hypothetical protein